MKRIVVGAHYGLKDWIIQRVTAVIMALFTLVLVSAILCVKPEGYAAWHALFSRGWMQFGAFLFFASLFYHAWIGVRDIWMDYVKPDGVRLVLMIMTASVLVGYAGWAAKILWRL